LECCGRLTDDYEVGYGRPPKSSQFKKGKSGNQPGSSRKTRDRKRRQNLTYHDVVLAQSEGSLRLREGDRTSEISVKEALLKKELAMGLNGNRLAIKASLARIDIAEQRKQAQFLDNYNTFLDYKNSYSARAKSHKIRGLPPPLPHINDVNFDFFSGEIKLTGPRDDSQLAELQKILQARTVFSTMLNEQLADVKECAAKGCPYSSSDLAIITELEKHLRSFDSELEKRGWLPRVAG
jgi:uncharacterized protein DUF5681